METERMATITENPLALRMKMEVEDIIDDEAQEEQDLKHFHVLTAMDDDDDDDDDEESSTIKLQKEVGEDVQHHFHVLAVDDSLIDRKLLEKLLHVSSRKCKVTCVDSGDKALKYLGLVDDLDNVSSISSESSPSSPQSPQVLREAVNVNLIMTDYCMPGMSGYDLLRRVKGSSWKHVPVVIMSSENVPSRINMCLEGGADEFLLKPLRLSDVKKLQPYIVGSSSLENNNNNNNNNSSSSEQESGNSDLATDNDCNPNSNNNACFCFTKRKAMSPQPSDRSRPKFK